MVPWHIITLAVTWILCVTPATAGWFGEPEDLTSSGYTRSEARHLGTVTEGVVLSVRAVRIEPPAETKTIGTTLGAVTGVVVGNYVGNGRGHLIATALGGIGGGIAGNAITQRVSGVAAHELTVRLRKSGKLVAVTQADSSEIVRAGDRVILIATDNGVRVTRRTY